MKLALAALDQLLVTLWHTLPWLAGLGLVFAVLSRLSPCNAGRPWWRKHGLATDLSYWIFVPIFLRYLRIWVTVWLTIMIFHINDGQKIADFYLHGHGPLSTMPLWIQGLIYLVGADFVLYWIHRAFHQGFAWKYHAVHQGRGLDQRGALSSRQPGAGHRRRRHRLPAGRCLARHFPGDRAVQHHHLVHGARQPELDLRAAAVCAGQPGVPPLASCDGCA
ncbi:MAG TPA: hypothetical protein VHC42_12030 [Rhizomicrobium sp.]|nr:hypothetical protein [Rhizomicrobium sp.]